MNYKVPDAAVQTVIDTYIDKVKHMAERSYEFDTPDQNGAWPDHQDAMVTVGELRALRRILPLISDATLTNVGAKPFDVAAVLKAICSLNIHEEAHNYEWRGEGGDYTPKPHEIAMLEDFGNSLIGQIIEAIGARANEGSKPVDVATFAQNLLSTYDQWFAAERNDDAAKAQSDQLIRAACFAGVAYEDAMSMPIMADKAPADLLRAFLIALVDLNSPHLDPYRAKNRSQSAELAQGARPLQEWHEDHGNVIWWAWDNDKKEWFGEPAYIGMPLDINWPDYHTHWTPHPVLPAAPTLEAQA